MWLEIKSGIVIGVHSEKLSNDAQWVEYDGEVMPGDSWTNDIRVPQPPEFSDQELLDIAARERIIREFPLWKQINIIRTGETESLSEMSNYIDSIRDWSNKPNASLDELENITR